MTYIIIDCRHSDQVTSLAQVLAKTELNATLARELRNAKQI